LIDNDSLILFVMEFDDLQIYEKQKQKRFAKIRYRSLVRHSRNAKPNQSRVCKQSLPRARKTSRVRYVRRDCEVDCCDFRDCSSDDDDVVLLDCEFTL